MPVPLSQLSSVTGVVSTSASSAVSAVVYAVVGPAVSIVSSSSAVPVIGQSWKWKRLTDLADHAWAWESLQDWWAFGRSTLSIGTSSAPQLSLVTPPIDPVPRPLPVLALSAAAEVSYSSRSVGSSSFCSSKRHHSQHSQGPHPVRQH